MPHFEVVGVSTESHVVVGLSIQFEDLPGVSTGKLDGKCSIRENQWIFAARFDHLFECLARRHLRGQIGGPVKKVEGVAD